MDGIKGESSDAAHPGTIEVASWSFGASNPTTTSGGAGAGKATFNDFTFTVAHDKSSPLLLLACAEGTHIPTAVLHVRRSNASGAGAPDEYFSVILEDVTVSGHGLSSPPAGSPVPTLPTQSLSLNFTKITYEYRANGATVRAGYDLVAAKKSNLSCGLS